MNRFISRLAIICSLFVSMPDGSPLHQPACPDWCGEELEPRSNHTKVTQPFEVTELRALCNLPSDGNILISWGAPSKGSDLVTGYRVQWYTGKLYCDCLKKNRRTFTLTNGTNGWLYPRHLAFMVKPLPRPGPKETFPLRGVHCMKDSKNSTIYPEIVEPRPEEIEAKYVVVSIGVAIGVFLSLIFYVFWRRVYRNKNHLHKDEEAQVMQKKLFALKDSVYVSYYSFNQAFTDQVHEISCWLIERGIHTIMDRMFSCEIAETGVIEWCEQHMSRARKVLIMCSKRFLEICNLRDQLMQEGKVVPERNLTTEQLKTMKEIAYIKRDMFLSGHSTDKFIVVLLGVREESLPLWMREFPVFSWPLERDNMVALINNQEIDVKAEA